MKNIDNLITQLIESGATLDDVKSAYTAAEAANKRKNKIAETRLGVLQSLRKYTTALYGSVDEDIMKEFEATLVGMEKLVDKPNNFHVEMKSGDVDDERLRKFIKAMGL